MSHPRVNLPQKLQKQRTSGEDKEASKGKRQYINIVSEGASREDLPSKGTMKRNIDEMLVVHKRDANASMKTLDWPMLGFRNSEKVGGTPNEIFPLVITPIIKKFDFYQILIGGGSWCDIMYYELFEKIGLEKGNLWLYEGSDMQEFNSMTSVYVSTLS